jgi:mannose-1-phosphate guanylyltransferase
VCLPVHSLRESPLTEAAALIIAGGRGTRFWPESRINHPKPLFSIDGRTSLLEATVARMQPLIDARRVFVLASADQASLFRPILKKLIPLNNLIVEPEGRGTAVAIAYGTGVIAKRLSDKTVVAVMPADHHVAPCVAFHRTLRLAIQAAASYASIVVIGVEPTRPETGYGYLKVGNPLPAAGMDGQKLSAGFSRKGGSQVGGNSCVPRHDRSETQRPAAVFQLDRFVEKPSAASAAKMVRSGRYLWNAGMFIMRASTLGTELARHAPALNKGMRSFPSMTPVRLRQEYRKLNFDSFDRVVLEKSQNVLGVRASFAWHDVGSWQGLWEALRGQGRNVLSGKVVNIDADGVLARARDRLVVLLGVRDIIAVETSDAILIAGRSQSQDVRKVIGELERRGLDRYL